MPLLATLVFDAALAFVLLFSCQSAAGWGELCGIRPGRDKSGLGGFAALYLFFLIRWLGLAVALWATAHVGEIGWLLLGHALVGAAAVWLFGRGLQRVQQDRFAPAWFGWLAGVVLPVPALALAVTRGNGRWLDALTPALWIAAAALLALHALCFHQRRRDLLARE